MIRRPQPATAGVSTSKPGAPLSFGFQLTISTVVLCVSATALVPALGQVPASLEGLAHGAAATMVDFRYFTRNPKAQEAHANNVVVYGEWNGPLLIDGVPEGYKIIDGDMIVPENFGEGQVAATYDTIQWVGGIVPYSFDANVTQANATAMLTAMVWWENVASVDFVPWDDSLYACRIYVQNSSANNSSTVGAWNADCPYGVDVLGGYTVINIANWNSTGIMAHELGHALGYFHEQSRVDRNSFVTINGNNICQSCCSGATCNSQFQIESVSLNYGPYDFASVMHYGPCAFSIGCLPATNCTCAPSQQTITVNPPFAAQWQNLIGQRTQLSYWDSVVMSFLYAPGGWRFQRAGGDDDGPGDFVEPYGTFIRAYGQTPVDGTLWILVPSHHDLVGTLGAKITIGAPMGGVVLGTAP